MGNLNNIRNSLGKIRERFPFLPKDEEEYENSREFFRELKRQRDLSIYKPTGVELLGIFPGVGGIISLKISEWEQAREELFDSIKEKLLLINRETGNETSRWFWRTWVKYAEGPKLMEIDRQLARLRMLQSITKGPKNKRGINDEHIQRALAVPIQNLIDFPLRGSGRTMVGLCPFHKEKHPSFNIYPETNSFWCFGCQEGGNVINYARLLYGFSFKEAVLFLIKQ